MEFEDLEELPSKGREDKDDQKNTGENHEEYIEYENENSDGATIEDDHKYSSETKSETFRKGPCKDERNEETKARYICTDEDCQVLLASMDSFRKHIRMFHPILCPYTNCKDILFSSQKSFNRHMEKHSNQPWICPRCSISINKKKRYMEHIRKVHSDMFKCPYEDCKRKTGSWSQESLDSHIKRVHLPDPKMLDCLAVGSKRKSRYSFGEDRRVPTFNNRDAIGSTSNSLFIEVNPPGESCQNVQPGFLQEDQKANNPLSIQNLCQ